MKKVITTERVPIKMWLDNADSKIPDLRPLRGGVGETVCIQ